MTTRIPLTDRSGAVVGHALVDDADAPVVSGLRWHEDGGYALHSQWDAVARRVIRVRMHRLILGLQPDDPHVDHRDLDRLNNQRSNLRLTTMAANKQNGRKYRANRLGGTPSSRYRGVHFRKERGTWVASGQISGRPHYIGSSHDEDEAGRMAAAWRRTNMPASEMDR